MKVLWSLLFAATPAAAQYNVIAAFSPDTRSDTLILQFGQEDDPSKLDLVVVTRPDDEDYATIQEIETFRNAFFAGRYNRPYFEALPTGAVRLNGLGCFLCGREHFSQSFTLDHRDGAWQMIGYTDSRVDRTAPWRFSQCDVNLVTRTAEITLADEPVARFDAPEDGPLALSDLTFEYRPSVCARANLTDEEWEKIRPAGVTD